jgi:MFS transporter, Spinster family, sphingosine-1-phosphate transporter
VTDQSSASPGYYRWIVLLLLFLAATLNYADRTAFSAVFPLVKKDLGMSDVELGAIGSLFLWSYAFMSPLAGMAGDRFSRSRLVTLSLGAWSIVTGLTGLVATTNQLFGARILLGISESLYIPAAMALIADHFTSSGRGRAMSIHIIGMQVGLVVGGYVAGYLGDRSGWRISLFALSAAGLVLAVFCHFILHDGTGKKGAAVTTPVLAPLPWRQGFAILLGVPSYYFLALEAMITSIGAWIFAYWMPLYYHETFNMSLTEAGLYGTVALSAGAWVGTLAGGWLSDQVTKRRGPRDRMLVQLLSYAGSAPFLLSFVWSTSSTLITACVFMFGLLQAVGATNAPPLWFDVLEKRVWSRAVGVMNFANCIMGGLGIYAAGFFKAQLGLKNVFAGVSGCMILAAVLLLYCYFVFLQKDIQRRAAAEAAAPA